LRILKKYPNRRLYDTQESVYVTLEDVRKMVLEKSPLQVLDSKTGKDLTRAVLLQIISEQETEGHEPLLTNKVLQQIIRFYGDSMQGVLSRYLEQSIMTFLEQQETYQRRMREVLNANPIKLMQRMADQNISFLRSVLQPGAESELPPEENAQGDSKVHNDPSESPEVRTDQSVGPTRTTDRSQD
jgi:polyhydroxyalkanoate synthesis repressor PhaR